MNEKADSFAGKPDATGAGETMLAKIADAASGQISITAIKALQPKQGATLIKIETDAGISGYGPCGESGPFARDVIAKLQHGRLPHLGLIGKDPLAIQVHYHNMFYAFPQRGRQVRVLSGIDIALWDLAGRILGQPVCKLLGGNFRDEIKLYSHCPQGDFLDRHAWNERAEAMKRDPHGFKAYKVDIHSVFGTPMQQFIPSIGPAEARQVQQAYALAREALGDDIDIIVHCHAELDVASAIKVAAAVEPIKPLYFEDPLAPAYSEAWEALRRSTRIPILTGENIELPENAMPFILRQTVDCLQPDLINCGGITGARIMADIAALYRVPVCLHNVSGYALNLASQQWSAAVFNCPLMECTRNADIAPEAAGNLPDIHDGKMKVSHLAGLGIELDQDYLKANSADGEPWWGE
ncbi:MAG: mandelate racemase/muconate lactonizing enzyme family protein [Chloroflexi bacterium]|nr:mandelate racemase/muconate lactonizing enzyme family protein [Chloroflexota bacterium]MCL5275179.1 mandelate racemase/muconate lactonizing enzyme family protein [Chloroflexota bacterium]